MVHYIRFLKPPRFDLAIKIPKRVLLSALITITTDLGDAFYPGDLPVYIAVVTHVGRISLGLTYWKPGMRCLKTQAKVPLEYLTSPAKLLFTCNESLETDSLQLGKVPCVVSAWTKEFRGTHDLITDVVMRRFTLLEGKVLEICEANGESIACHIWDAAIALAAWLMCYKGKVWQAGEKQHKILELGTGCGMVGLVLGSMSQNSRLILTDEDDDSLALATENAQKSREVFNSVWECRSLDWREPHRFSLDGNLGLIVASDCTYNSGSIPCLVQTISDLVQQSNEMHKESPTPRIIVSTKRRHPSEAMFVELMEKSGFDQLEHATIPMHDRHRESMGMELEVVDVYIYERRIG